MNPLTLVFTVLMLLAATRLADVYLGGSYVCPSCGSRSQDGHSIGCPWNAQE
jgi:hypothetical protein